MDKSLFEPTLLVIGFEKDKTYSIENVHTIFLNKTRVLGGIYSLFLYILKYKPNIVMSSITHVNIVLGIFSFFFPIIKFIAREASVGGNRVVSKSLKNALLITISKIAYPRLNKIICQSKDMRIDLLNNYKLSPEKVLIINNPITNFKDVSSIAKPRDKNSCVRYITIGRLVEVKGHLRILKALSKISFDYSYTIIGEGPLKDDIFKAIIDYGIQDKIIYIPFTSEVSKYLMESDLFLQGSFVEGFPNAVLESCAVGTPVLAFNAPGGTKEIIEDFVNGFIVNNETEFFTKLNEKQNWNPSLIKNHVFQKFSKDKIMESYSNLFLEVLTNSARS
ncbi:glycosyltransferase [Arenibacter sp. F26102]|nr:glycosyltransferase [Arenibacter sp. F26102]